MFKFIKTYLGEVLPQDATIDPGKALATACKKHGWGSFQRELESAFQRTTAATLERNVRELPGRHKGRFLVCTEPSYDKYADAN